MARFLFVRITGGLGILALATLFVGVIPFLSADPTAGAGLSGKAPGFSVNRQFKGDRLPYAPVVTPVSRDVIQTPRRPTAIPVGCDPAFSPISTPQLAYVYGRCMT